MFLCVFLCEKKKPTVIFRWDRVPCINQFLKICDNLLKTNVKFEELPIGTIEGTPWVPSPPYIPIVDREQVINNCADCKTKLCHLIKTHKVQFKKRMEKECEGVIIDEALIDHAAKESAFLQLLDAHDRCVTKPNN